MAKNVQKEIMEQVMQLMAERDESIRQAFTQMHQNIGNSFGAVDFKLNVIFSALNELGVSQETIQGISTELQKRMQEQQQTPEGGETNDPYGKNTPPESVSDTEESGHIDGESGDEHFGND